MTLKQSIAKAINENSKYRTIKVWCITESASFEDVERGRKTLTIEVTVKNKKP